MTQEQFDKVLLEVSKIETSDFTNSEERLEYLRENSGFQPKGEKGYQAFRYSEDLHKNHKELYSHLEAALSKI